LWLRGVRGSEWPLSPGLQIGIVPLVVRLARSWCNKSPRRREAGRRGRAAQKSHVSRDGDRDAGREDEALRSMENMIREGKKAGRTGMSNKQRLVPRNGSDYQWQSAKTDGEKNISVDVIIQATLAGKAGTGQGSGTDVIPPNCISSRSSETISHKRQVWTLYGEIRNEHTVVGLTGSIGNSGSSTDGTHEKELRYSARVLFCDSRRC